MTRAAAWPFRVAAARATLRALANMDAHELADIGLNPCDLRDVSALPLDRDPTGLLTQRARERRRDAFAAPTPPRAATKAAIQGRAIAGPRGGNKQNMVDLYTDRAML
jgi:hypothetical protein